MTTIVPLPTASSTSRLAVAGAMTIASAPSASSTCAILRVVVDAMTSLTTGRWVGDEKVGGVTKPVAARIIATSATAPRSAKGRTSGTRPCTPRCCQPADRSASRRASRARRSSVSRWTAHRGTAGNSQRNRSASCASWIPRGSPRLDGVDPRPRACRLVRIATDSPRSPSLGCRPGSAPAARPRNAVSSRSPGRCSRARFRSAWRGWYWRRWRSEGRRSSIRGSLLA